MSTADNANIIPMPEDSEYDLTRGGVNAWLQDNENPSPTAFALDFNIRPAELASKAQTLDWVSYALYRMVGLGESLLTGKAYGPKAYIQRVEMFLGEQTIADADLGDENTDDSGLFG